MPPEGKLYYLINIISALLIITFNNYKAVKMTVNHVKTQKNVLDLQFNNITTRGKNQ